MRTQKKAFTIIELMVVLGVIAVLATMAIFGINLLNKSVEATQRKNVLTQLETYVQSYKNDNGSVPVQNQISFSASGSITITNGTAVTDTGIKYKGNANEYCYSSDGLSYSMGVRVNGKNTFRGTGADCTITATN